MYPMFVCKHVVEIRYDLVCMIRLSNPDQQFARCGSWLRVLGIGP